MPGTTSASIYKNSSDAGAAVDAFRHVTEIDPDRCRHLVLSRIDLRATQTISRSDRSLRTRIEARSAPRLRPVRTGARLPAVRTSRYRPRSDEEVPVHHAEQTGRARSAWRTENRESIRARKIRRWQWRKCLPQIPVQFVDVTNEQGGDEVERRSGGSREARNCRISGPGACFLDYDNDGQALTCCLPIMALKADWRYFTTLGGKFEDVTKKAGLDPTMHALGCTTGDYDNDGFADIAVDFERSCASAP